MDRLVRHLRSVEGLKRQDRNGANTVLLDPRNGSRRDLGRSAPPKGHNRDGGEQVDVDSPERLLRPRYPSTSRVTATPRNSG